MFIRRGIGAIWRVKRDVSYNLLIKSKRGMDTTPKKDLRVTRIKKTEKEDEKEEVKVKSKHFKPELHWKKHETILYAENIEVNRNIEKIAAFDMDSTLIFTKSGYKFAQNPRDWKFFDQTVKPTLQKLVQEGMRVVVFSNQAGIGNGKVPEAEYKQKIQLIQKELTIPLTLLAATESDKYRKPSVGMWKFFSQKLSNVKINLSQSFFCGDAAGRKKTATKAADFSDGDIKFALNVGVKFKLPQDLFGQEMKNQDITKFLDKKQDKKKAKIAGFNPKELPSTGSIFEDGKDDQLTPQDGHQEVIIFVGPPGGGKSTFWNNYLKAKGYIRINQDTLKTKEKCLKVLKETLKQGLSACMDATHRNKEVRALYTKAAEELDVPVRVFLFEVPKEVALHLDAQRKINTHRTHFSKRVGRVVIATYYKQLEPPKLSEGFKQIKKVRFVAGPFTNEADRECFESFS